MDPVNPNPADAGQGTGTAAAPAEVTYTLKAPEKSPLPEKHTDGVIAFAKEHKLAPEVAQKLLDRDHGLLESHIKSTTKVAPEKYDLKLPKDAVLDASALERIAAHARERGLSQEDAQALVDRDNATISSYVAGQQARVKALNDGQWATELKNDPEIGGDKLAENGKVALTAAKQWFGDAFVEFLVAQGLNHHPMLFRGLVKLGLAGKDGGIPKDATPVSKDPVKPEDKLYGPKEPTKE